MWADSVGTAACWRDKAAVMQWLSRPNNVIVSQWAEQGSVQSADSSAAPAEGHLLWHWAYFRPCNYGVTVSQVLRHHTQTSRAHTERGVGGGGGGGGGWTDELEQVFLYMF